MTCRHVFSTTDCIPLGFSPAEGETAVLLAGEWPGLLPPRTRVLDRIFTGAWAFLDEEAGRLAEIWERTAPLPARLKAGTVRYLLVRLLRLTNWFGSIEPPPRRSLVLFYGDPETSAVAAAALEDLFARLGVRLELRPGRTEQTSSRIAPATDGWPQKLFAGLRRTVRRCLLAPAEPWGETPQAGSRVLCVGDPALLGPVAFELRERGHDVRWWWAEASLREVWRLRRRGIPSEEIRPIESSPGETVRRAAGGSLPLVTSAGLDLAPALRIWWRQERLRSRDAVVGLQAAAEAAWERRPPRLVLVDQDAGGLQRGAIELARRDGATGLVVQHGIPAVRFGFLPLAADALCVWGATSAATFREWGLESGRIWVTGSPKHDAVQAVPGTGAPSRPRRLLILGTTSPREDRPDALAFHWTTASARLFRAVPAEVARRRPDLEVVFRPHPRERGGKRPKGGKVRTDRGPLDRSLAAADVVLTLASTAGAEALLYGLPVIQWMPGESLDMLPAERWGWAACVRSVEELLDCLAELELRGRSAGRTEDVFAQTLRPAAPIAATVAEALLARAAALPIDRRGAVRRRAA